MSCPGLEIRNLEPGVISHKIAPWSHIFLEEPGAFCPQAGAIQK